MNCVCCGSRVAGNVSPDRCLHCYQAQLRWWDASNWIPLAAERIAYLEAERDLFRRETVALVKDAWARDWQPIDTAPRLGARVLVWDRISGVLAAQYLMGAWYAHEIRQEVVPTHWQPLPAPPSEGE